MTNCFLFTYKSLRRLGYELPTEFEGYTMTNQKQIIADHDILLEEEKHLEYFRTFCDEVDVAQKDDIIATKDGSGFAINKFKYMTLEAKRLNPVLLDITKDCIIFRIKKEEVE